MSDRPRQDSGSIFPAQSVARARTLADADNANATPATTAKPPATEAISRRMGAMVDEVDFPGFVAGLVHGTFDAIVDASIKQMESFSSLVSAVAKSLDQFTEENVTNNQARDWLAQRYPGDVRLLLPDTEHAEPRLEPREEGKLPVWLSAFDLDNEELTSDLLEQTVLPQVRRKIGEQRQQMLATMVTLGMNRVAVRDGSITAKVMFRAAAQDSAKVGYATNSDPASVGNWGERGSLSQGGASTMVSTLAVNAQSDASVKADLFGEVKLNFVSETLPLDRLVDPVKMSLINRNSVSGRAMQETSRGNNATTPAANDGRGDN